MKNILDNQKVMIPLSIVIGGLGGWSVAACIIEGNLWWVLGILPFLGWITFCGIGIFRATRNIKRLTKSIEELTKRIEGIEKG